MKNANTKKYSFDSESVFFLSIYIAAICLNGSFGTIFWLLMSYFFPVSYPSFLELKLLRYIIKGILVTTVQQYKHIHELWK